MLGYVDIKHVRDDSLGHDPPAFAEAAPAYAKPGASAGVGRSRRQAIMPSAVRSGNAPYKFCKIIYCVCINNFSFL